MKNSKIITLCVLLVFVSVLGDVGSAKIKNPLKKIDNPFNKKDDKKKKEQKRAMLEAQINAQANAQKEAQLKAMTGQLSDLKQPKGLASDTKASKLEETPVSGTKKETRETGKTIDGSPVTYITTTERFKASAAFDQQILLNPGTDVIYPGSVLLGHTIASGTYKEISKGSKNSITLSYDLTNIKKKRGAAGRLQVILYHPCLITGNFIMRSWGRTSAKRPLLIHLKKPQYLLIQISVLNLILESDLIQV